MELTVDDLFAMQETCAYEVRGFIPYFSPKNKLFLQTVALGFSKFCELFTEKEWEGFDYAYAIFSLALRRLILVQL